MATIYTAREREATDIPIDAVYRNGRLEILPEVQGHDYFDIRFRGDKLTITAGKYLGLVPLTDHVFIQVEPKMPVPNLLAVLSAVGGEVVELKSLEREYRLAPHALPQILDAIVIAFVATLRHLEVEGLRKQYESITDSGPFLKGQTRFNDSVQRHWSRGRRHLAVCSYFDLTADLPENRLLRYACRLLLTQHVATGVFRRNVPELAHYEEVFSRSGVRLTHPSEDAIGPTALLPPEYVRAVRLARIIVSGQGVELPAGGPDVALPSFLVNMETLFERYIRHVLAARLGGVQVLDGNAEGGKPLFDDRLAPSANPDIVLRRGEQYPLIGEVKYKSGETRDDINQVLGYALAYRTTVIVVILPAETAAMRGVSEIGVVQQIRIVRYRFDLAAANLDAEEEDFANAVTRLVPLPGTV